MAKLTDVEIKAMLERMPAARLKSGYVRTCPARLSYPAVFEKAKPYKPGQEAKYQVVMLFPKGANLAALNAYAGETAAKKWDDWQAKRKSGAIKWPIRDQSLKAGKAGFVAGAGFITPKSNDRPPIVDAMGQPITDAGLVYGGCWARAVLSCFAFDDGVTFILKSLQKVADDERFGAAASDPKQDFDPIEPIGVPSFGDEDAGALEDEPAF